MTVSPSQTIVVSKLGFTSAGEPPPSNPHGGSLAPVNPHDGSPLVSGVGQGMDVLDGGGYRRKGRGSFRVNFGHLIITKDVVVVAYLCRSA